MALGFQSPNPIATKQIDYYDAPSPKAWENAPKAWEIAPKAWEFDSQSVGGLLPKRGSLIPKAWEVCSQGVGV
ncbi:MAG: hypothetical protein ACI3YC_05610 [Alloprevotella sp.]